MSNQQEKIRLIDHIYGAIFAFIALFWAAILVLLARLLRQPVGMLIDLEMWSASWQNWKSLYVPLKWTAGIVAVCALGVVSIAWTMTPWQAREVLVIICGTFLIMISVLAFTVLYWMERYAEDPEVSRHVAGKQAECIVAKRIDACQSRLPQSIAMHGALFVFKRGTDQEFSAEADHVLITRQHVYLVETKYKSGTISAGAESPTWTTSSEHGEGSMRNALLQVKNSARVLQRECGLPCACIPLVAIHGQETRIVDGPGNVVVAEDIGKAILAFEQADSDVLLDPDKVWQQLAAFRSDDKADMKRHIERAQKAAVKSELAEIVRTASR